MKKGLVMVSISILAILFLTNSVLAKVIKIGAVFPFTGQLAVHAEDAKRTLELAQDEINALGGINRDEIKFIYEDSGGTPKGGASAAQKLIEIDKVDMIIGDLFSSVVLAMKPIITSKKVILLAPMASHPNIWPGTKYIFTMMATDNDYGYVIAKYCSQVLKKKTLSTLYMMNDTGIESDRMMAKWWEHFGGRTLVRESFSPGSTDFRTQLTKIRSDSADVVYMNVTWREGANILKQAFEMNVKTQFAANSQIKEAKLLELSGSAAEGVIFVTPHTGATEEDKKVKGEFEKNYMEKYKQPPGIVSYATYDCTKVIFEALRRGAKTTDEIRETIVKLDIPGVFGHIRYREDGSPKKDAEMWIIKEGKFIELNYADHAP